MGRQLQEMWKEERVDGRDHLRQFLLEIRKLPFVSEHMVQAILYFEPGNEVSGEGKTE